MEAPDKIYIHPDISEKDFIRPWIRNRFSNLSIAYLNRDMILKWIEEKLNESTNDDEKKVFNQVIDKIKSI